MRDNLIEIRVIDKTYGYYFVNANDIPNSHKSGEYWIEEGTVYLDQFHKYQDELFKAINEVNHEGN